jgi:hypothetical protein
LGLEHRNTGQPGSENQPGASREDWRENMAVERIGNLIMGLSTVGRETVVGDSLNGLEMV